MSGITIDTRSCSSFRWRYFYADNIVVVRDILSKSNANFGVNILIVLLRKEKLNTKTNQESTPKQQPVSLYCFLRKGIVWGCVQNPTPNITTTHAIVSFSQRTVLAPSALVSQKAAVVECTCADGSNSGRSTIKQLTCSIEHDSSSGERRRVVCLNWYQRERSSDVLSGFHGH